MVQNAADFLKNGLEQKSASLQNMVKSPIKHLYFR